MMSRDTRVAEIMKFPFQTGWMKIEEEMSWTCFDGTTRKSVSSEDIIREMTRSVEDESSDVEMSNNQEVCQTNEKDKSTKERENEVLSSEDKNRVRNSNQDFQFSAKQDMIFDSDHSSVKSPLEIDERNETISETSSLVIEHQSSTTDVTNTTDNTSRASQEEYSRKLLSKTIDFSGKLCLNRNGANEKPDQSLQTSKYHERCEPKKKKFEVNRVGEKRHKCSYCDKRFQRLSHKTVHERTHTGEKPYGCSYCDKSFSQQGSVKAHERTHTGEKPFQCLHCDNKFSSKTSLKKHMMIHSGETPYQWPHCPKRFPTSGELKSHKRTRTEKKPYQCPHCDKKFTQVGNLQIHIRLHTGEKPYHCTDCNESFSRLDALKRHKLSHSNENS